MTEKPHKKLKLLDTVSPVGIAKYSWLTKADTGYDGKSKPKFKTRVLLDDTPENREWVAGVVSTSEKFAKENGIKLKKVYHTPFNFPEDEDEDDFIPAEGKDKPKLDEDHRGRIYFEAKSDYKPGLIDTSSPPVSLPDGVTIMSGDKLRIKVELNPYEGLGSGLSLRLKVAQLVEKNTSFSGGGHINTDGFDDIDGGYKADISGSEDF